MESLYLLIPLSLVLVLGIGGLLVWSVMSGQFDDLDEAGRRALGDDESPAQRRMPPAPKDGGGGPGR